MHHSGKTLSKISKEFVQVVMCRDGFRDFQERTVLLHKLRQVGCLGFRGHGWNHTRSVFPAQRVASDMPAGLRARGSSDNGHMHAMAQQIESMILAGAERCVE